MTLLCVAVLGSVRADIGNMFEQTLMPGPLSHAHEKLQKDCNNCHRLFNKKAQMGLCVACHDHKNIKTDIDQSKGFHGKNPDVKDTPCRDCHTEHEGRDTQIVEFDEKKFDHRQSDFQLDKSHEKVACDKCHRENKPYHLAPGLCLDCHEKKDVHKGEFGKKCGDCHLEPKWKEVKYDHNKARFKLRQSHRDVECKDCHDKKKYRFERRTCDVCHLADDKHKRRFGLKCEKCHNEKKWDVILFSHNKDTDYALAGKHIKAKCESCHRKNPYEKKTTEVCNDCHKKEDEHKGLLGSLCDDCHTERRWKHIRFNHNNTRYVLTGGHRQVECHDCHRLNRKQNLRDAACIDCHLDVDVHKDELGSRCESCHVPTGWISVETFDHDLSRFPIVGEHIDVLCEECHIDNKYRKTTPILCKECHFEPPVHANLFGDKCESCHVALDWMTWRFSHDMQTEFKLRGKHNTLSCYDCHKAEWGGRELAKDCIACHIMDDIHGGKFGSRCGDCHTEKSFKGAEIAR